MTYLYIRHMIPGIIRIPKSALIIIDIKPKLLGLSFASVEKCVRESVSEPGYYYSKETQIKMYTILRYFMLLSIYFSPARVPVTFCCCVVN